MYFPHHFYRPALIHDSCDLNKIGCCKLNAIATGPLHTYSPFTYKCHKSNIKNLLMKSSDIVFIFLPAFYLVIWLMTSPKNFEKIAILKNMTAVFLLRYQNWLRREISLICHWNIDSWKQKLTFVYVMVPKNDQNIIQIHYRLH